MSRKDKLIKSKSIYTLRSKHTSLVNGTIYENDHVTIIPNDGVYNEDIPLFSESNFKFRIGTGNGERKRHSRGGWINVNGTETSVWTLSNLPISNKTEESKIVIKPNYTSLKDFAYYGSTVELIKATVNDIIARYPGGISYYKNPPEVLVNGNTYYLVSNEFNIDFWTPPGVSKDGLENPMRVLGASYMNYEDSQGKDIGLNVCITGNCPNSIIGRVSFTNTGKRTESNNDRGTDDFYDEVFGYGLEYSDGGIKLGASNNGTPGVTTQPETYNWSQLVVICYSGVSETNYLTDVTIPNIPLYCTLYDTNGANVTVTGISNSNGEFLIQRKMLNQDLALCISSCEISGEYCNKNFVNTARFNCSDQSDKIVKVFINCKADMPPGGNFPYIFTATNCETNAPVEGVEVVFYTYLTMDPGLNPNIPETANKPFYSKTYTTDSNGMVYIDQSETNWFKPTGEPFTIHGNWFITSWYVKYSYGETSNTTRAVDGSVNSLNGCVVIEDAPIPFTEIKVQGVFAGNSEPIGPGHRAVIVIYDRDIDSPVEIDSLTIDDGSYKITDEEFKERYPERKRPNKFYCSIEYCGDTKTSRTVNFPTYSSTGFIPRAYSEVLTFSGVPTGTLKTLMVSVVSKYGNIYTPLNDVVVNFTGKTHKDIQYTTTAKTVQGIATAFIPSENWTGNGGNLSALDDINEWNVSCNFEGQPYTGEGGTNYLDDGDATDRIVIPGKTDWTSIKVYTKNSQGNFVSGVRVKVHARIVGSKRWTFVVQGVSSNGVAVFTPSSNWNVVENAPNAILSNIVEWKCEGWTDEEHQYGIGEHDGINPIRDGENNEDLIVFQIVEPPTPPQPPHVGDCDSITNGFDIYLDGEGKKHLLTRNNSNKGSVIIRPKSAYTEEFWSTLDDFEKVLLDRTTTPIYRARLESPYIEENKHFYKLKTYTWPTVDTAGTPDLTSLSFQGYLTSLMKIAEYYDEYDSDNLWRMMTHESIKNLDWSFTRYTGNDIVETNEIDYTRMQAMLRTEARLFDDIKRYADNIKHMNKISYDEKNNAPDYFLTDNVELNGFEAASISNFSGVTISRQADSLDSNPNDMNVNSEFMRRMALSAKYLLSMKGTRRGIEGILGMFGYRYVDSEEMKNAKQDNIIQAGDYSIKEYIGVANKFPKYAETASLRVLGENEYLNADNNMDWMVGYPVTTVSPAIENATEEDYYLIPWMNNKEKYYNEIYFQEKGGWNRMQNKEINLGISNVSEISEQDFNIRIYGETEPYMTYVSNISELTSLSNAKVYDGMICYVTDISGIYTTYSADTDYNTVTNTTTTSHMSDITSHDDLRGGSKAISQASTSTQPQIQHLLSRDYSHYFILKNSALSNYIGFVHNDLYNCYGWKNIYLSEFQNEVTSEDGFKVLYLESLQLNNKGNNPHCGFGKYDDGESYFEKYNYLFGTALNTGEFDYLKDGSEDDKIAYNKIVDCGFDIEVKEDNKKCYFFTNNSSENRVKYIRKENGNGNEDVSISGTGEYNKFVNPENGEKYDEAAANSILNAKMIEITFETKGNDYFKKYIKDVVSTYLYEMIPSTTILRIKFDGEDTYGNPIAADSTTLESGIDIVVGDMAATGGNDMYLTEDNRGLIGE